MTTKWTSKQGKALPLLAGGLSGASTALAVGCKESTVSYWINHCPEFMTELERLRDQATRQAMDQLQGTFAVAVGELLSILTTSNTDAVRLKAAMFIIGGAAPTKTPRLRSLDPETTLEIERLNHVFNQFGLANASP